jgi:hypothetical protein
VRGKSDGSCEAAATKSFLFLFSFSTRLIVNRVRRKEEKKTGRKTKTTMMMKKRMVERVVIRRSRVLRMSTNEALPPLDDVVDIQHVLSHDMLMLYTTIRSLL